MSQPPGNIFHMASAAHLEAVPEHSISTPASTTVHSRAGQATAVRFSESVRAVVALTRRGGLTVPVFRSPPNCPGVDRTIRRRGTEAPVVAIARHDRPLAAVQADLIEGVVVSNDLDELRADRFRRAAWRELDQHGMVACPDDPVVDLRSAGTGEGPIRVAS